MLCTIFLNFLQYVVVRAFSIVVAFLHLSCFVCVEKVYLGFNIRPSILMSWSVEFCVVYS